MKKYRFDYFASCPTGFEEVLAFELKALGVKSAALAKGGVRFEAFHEIALKVILFSRLASRVFKYLYSFEVKNEKDYYLEATDIKWKSLMDVSQTFRLTTVFGDLPRGREEFKNSQFANLKLKDAIVDYFRHFEGERPSISKDNPDVSFLARIEQGQNNPYLVTILYDLCGSPLNQRGYRIAKTTAPLKENVAAGLLQLSRWDPLEENLLDAMCGSGTIAIEGALIAGDIPPSYLKVQRSLKNPAQPVWAFQNYPWFQKDELLKKNFQDLLMLVSKKTNAGIEELKKKKIIITANDVSQFDLISARENIKKAQLDDVIEVTHQDALNTSSKDKRTLFICNPPYGERLEAGEEEKLRILYKGLGDHWKQNFKGHRASLFTGNFEMLKVVGLKTSKKHILYNGDIECRLAEYELY